MALLNRQDPHHAICVEAVKRLPVEPLLTTWPCFTEAMYLVGRARGYLTQEALWRLRGAGRLVLHAAAENELGRMAELMAKYQDLPMDLADASLVATAESLGIRRIFTIDRDSHIYRFTDNTSVEVFP